VFAREPSTSKEYDTLAEAIEFGVTLASGGGCNG